MEAGVDAEIADEAGELVEAVALAVALVVAAVVAVVAVVVVEGVALQPLHDEFQHLMFCVQL